MKPAPSVPDEAISGGWGFLKCDDASFRPVIIARIHREAIARRSAMPSSMMYRDRLSKIFQAIGEIRADMID